MKVASSLNFLLFSVFLLSGRNGGEFADSYCMLAATMGNDVGHMTAFRRGIVLKRKLTTADRSLRVLCVSSANIQFDGHEKSARGLSDAMFDLSGIKNSNSSPEAQNLLVVLKSRLENFHGSFTADEVSRALYGLQGMTDDCPYALALLSAFKPILKGCEEKFNALQLGMMNYGLQGIRANADAKFFVDFIYDEMDLLVRSTAKFTLLCDDDVQLLGKHFALTSSELREAFKDKYPRWEELNLLICDELAYRKGAGDLTFSTTSAELTTAKVKLLEHKYITMSSNYNLLAAYEFDVGGEYKSVIDIDVHTNADINNLRRTNDKNVRFCLSRDKHLSRQSNDIQKFGAVYLRPLDLMKFNGWLLSRISIS